MPPLRKKGRGGGGSKTQAPLPGEMPGTSPSTSVSVARKEREKRMAISGQGIENVGVTVSRSFQKERGEKKLFETSRMSLHLTSGTFQRSLRARKTEPSSTDSTPRVMDVSASRDAREKRFSDSVQNAPVSSDYSACRGKEESSVCRTSCRELGDDKVFYGKSLRAVEEKLIRRVGHEKSVQYSTRYNSIYPGTSPGKAIRESQSLDGGSLRSGGSLVSQRLERGDDSTLLRASPSSPALLRKSPRSEGVTTTTSPGISLPVKSSCKCGVFRSSGTGSSPGLPEKLGLVSAEDRRRGSSPLPPSVTTHIIGRSGRSEGTRRKSRELSESLQGIPSMRSTVSESRSNTPNLLQGRLALLEGRVSQIAAELKATRGLLDANNPACSKAVLTDIQLKITGIEKAISYRLARECGLVDQLDPEHLKGTHIQVDDSSGRNFTDGKNKNSGKGSKSVSTASETVPHGQGLRGKSSKNALNLRAITTNNSLATEGRSMSAAEKLSHITSRAVPRGRDPSIFQSINEGSFPPGIGGSAPTSLVKSTLDPNEFEERLFPHQKLIRSRPAVHRELMENRTALHQKLAENSVLLRNKLAALEERDGVNCGALIGGDFGAAEFISSLKQGHGSRKRDFEKGKAAKGESRSSRALRVCSVDVGDSFPQGFHEYTRYEGDAVMAQNRSSSRDGRRSSSRKGFLGTPSDQSVLILHSLEKSSGSRSERRKGSEKRKSISTAECCSPDPFHGPSQIVMLEPTGRPLDTGKSPRAPLTVDPLRKSVMGLTCTEAFQDSRLTNSAYVKEWLEDGLDGEASRCVSSLCPPCDEAVVNLGCDEGLSSDGIADDFQDFVIPAIEDDEQPYLGESEDNVPGERLHQVGEKIVTSGWFISEGEAILLAHDDGYCSFYDVVNMEGKANFRGPSNLPFGTWRDCWLIRAAGSDGASHKFVLAASVGSAMDPAFCSWDFYDRKITAFHSESSLQASPSLSFRSSESSSPERRRWMVKDRLMAGCFSWYSGSDDACLLKGRTPSGPLSLDFVTGGSHSICSMGPSDSGNLNSPVWWYQPCSPLIASAGTGLKTITMYDVRDGDVMLKWDLTRSIGFMEFSSPIQWRTQGRIVIAEDQGIGLWDTNSRALHCVQSISLGGKELRALHVWNSDGESNGGVRQRVSSRDGASGDGVLCTQDAINVLDYRMPAGIALKIPTFGEIVHSVTANGDSVFAGVSVLVKGVLNSRVCEWSLKQGRPMSMYDFPESSVHQPQQSVAQVWGNSETVMGVNGNGLFVFDSLKGVLPVSGGQSTREILGADDLFQPTFDFAANKVLLISRDRPALWCRWP